MQIKIAGRDTSENFNGANCAFVCHRKSRRHQPREKQIMELITKYFSKLPFCCIIPSSKNSLEVQFYRKERFDYN